jgi:uncharacterized protein (TIGR02569 family)
MVEVGKPPHHVLESFGAQGPMAPLPRGRTTSWRCGDLVLKPPDMSAQMLQWQATVLTGLEGRDDFRVAPPKAAADGSLSVDGWTCWPYLAGDHPIAEWAAVVATGEAFHAALRDVPRPGFLDDRDDDWAIADRFAWGEQALEDHLLDPDIADLAERLEPVDQHSQLIHGDLAGNVLLHADLPPAVIDVSPYWRPTSYAAAVVVADALLWYDAGRDVLALTERSAVPAQMLLRAMLFRLVADRLGRASEPIANDRYRHLVSEVCRWADAP